MFAAAAAAAAGSPVFLLVAAAAAHGRTSACSGVPSGSFGRGQHGQPLALRRRTARPDACPQADTVTGRDSSWSVSGEV